MSVIGQILASKRKPKEKVTLVVEKVRGDRKLITQLADCLRAGSAPERRNCLEATRYLSKDDPSIVLPFVDVIIEHLGDVSARVKWESAEVIHNLAKSFPDAVVRAIPKLLANTNGGSTTARWSAAYALTEIAYHNPGLRQNLFSEFNNVLKKERNHRVRNIYMKALKSFGPKD